MRRVKQCRISDRKVTWRSSRGGIEEWAIRHWVGFPGNDNRLTSSEWRLRRNKAYDARILARGT